ncbi:hypothetical protein Tco_0639807 [Tanacetum coccineum]
MEEIDIFLSPDDSIPPGIENDDYDSEGDVIFLEELLNDDSFSLPEYESFHVDFYNVPSSPRPPEKSQDDDVYIDIELDTGVLTNVNPLVDEVLENIESKDSYVSNLDESALLITPLSDFNEDECFDPGSDIDEIELLLHRDLSTPKISVASILEGFTDEPPLEENDDLFDLESKESKWKKILYDASIDDLMIEDKVFDPDIHEKKVSPTYVSLPFEDRHYLSLTYVIRIFLPYLTYPVDSSLPLSSRSKDNIFYPGISAFHFSSLEPVAYKCPMEVCSSMCFIPNITMIWGESS